jgi:histidinol-phosphate aminotransferase
LSDSSLSSILKPLLRPELAELAPYTPHPGTFAIRLDANEAPPFLSAQGRKRLADATAEIAWERYPDVAMPELRAALAARSGVGSEEVLVGVGSDEIIALLLTALGQPRQSTDLPLVLTTTPTFVMYRMSARVRGQRVLEVPLDDDWDLGTTSLAAAMRVSEPSVVFIASPNNPTGNQMSLDRLAALAEIAKNSVVVIDEAYVDYSAHDQLELYRRYPNVVVLRTLSKIGFAALRVGWIIARPELVRELDKARLPYNLSSVSQRLATVAVTELEGEIRRGIAGVLAERARLAERLAALPGVRVTPSQANFLWLKSEAPAEAVFKALCAQGILVRSFHSRGGRLAHCLRVTIGTPAENDAFLAAYGKLV